MKSRPESKFRLGANTWLSRAPLEKIIKIVSNLGYDDVEIAGYPGDFSAERRASVKKLLRENDLDTVSVSVGVPFFRNPQKLNLHASNREVRETSIRYVHDCVDLAAELEGDLVYVCSILKDTQNEPLALENFSDSLAACAQHAAAAGVRIALEPYPRSQVATTEQAVELVSKLGLRNLGLILDTGHLLIGRESLKDSVELARRFLMHVHINNNDGFRDAHWPPQIGNLTIQDFKGFIRSLESTGYDKYVSIELADVQSIETSLSNAKQFVSSLLRG